MGERTLEQALAHADEAQKILQTARELHGEIDTAHEDYFENADLVLLADEVKRLRESDQVKREEIDRLLSENFKLETELGRHYCATKP